MCIFGQEAYPGDSGIYSKVLPILLPTQQEFRMYSVLNSGNNKEWTSGSFGPQADKAAICIS